MKRIFIVVLHYGDSNLTLNCIKSILRNKKLKIINNKENLGYAGGMNIGIRYALSKGADYVLLLNNDVFFEKEIISNLVNFFEKNKNAGIVAPAIKFIKKKKKKKNFGGKDNKIFGRTSHNEAENINEKNIKLTDYVSGCCMLIKKEVFQKIGLFDEKFFLYYEDVDFCLRAKKAGFKTFVLPSVSIYHKLSESVGKNSSTAVYNQTKSALIFAKKNSGLKRFLNLGFILFQSFLFLLKNPKSGIHSFRALFNFYKNNFLLYLLILILLSLLSYHKVLGFAFWKDDWYGIYQKDHLNSFLLHPGATLEWVFLSKLFGENTFFWQLTGILLRILDSVAIYLMMRKVSKSRIAGFLSGIFFASTFGALDTVGWASAHISSIAIFFMCLSVYFWLKFYEDLKNKNFLLYFIFLILAMLADPIRVVPIIILLAFLRKTIFKENKNSKFAKIIQGSFYLFLVLVFLFVFWYLNLTGYPGFSLIPKIIDSPSYVLNKSYLIGNYWGSLGNLILGWIISIPENASTGEYNKLYARIAFILVPFLSIFIFLFYRLRSGKFAIAAFLISWILVFYLPNWIAEPRLTMGGTHRFLNFSTVGFISLVAFGISFIRARFLLISFAIFFVIMNIITSNRILVQESKYRSKEIVEAVWNKIDNDFPKNEKDSIFIYRGEEPLRGNILALSGSIPIGIKRNIKDPYDFPIVTDDLDLIVKLLCFENVTRFQPGKYVIQKERIHINNIHAWEIKNNGSIINISKMERERIRKFAEVKCKVIEN